MEKISNKLKLTHKEAQLQHSSLEVNRFCFPLIQKLRELAEKHPGIITIVRLGKFDYYLFRLKVLVVFGTCHSVDFTAAVAQNLAGAFSRFIQMLATLAVLKSLPRKCLLCWGRTG